MGKANSIDDFLRTIDSDESAITCPACGSPMGVRRGGFKMHLQDNLRNELEENIASLRLFLDQLERTLERRNLPLEQTRMGDYPYRQERAHYSENQFKEDDDSDENYSSNSSDKRFLRRNGVYQGILGNEITNKFVRTKLDFFEFIRNYDDFPLKDEKDKDKLLQSCRSLLKGIEPFSLIGNVMSIVLDIDEVFFWSKSMGETPNILDDLLLEVTPTIKFYLDKLNELGVKEDPSLARSIFRAKIIIAICLGHKSGSSDRFELGKINIHTNLSYALPRLTAISYHNLLQLCQSEVLLGNPQIKLSVEFKKWLKYSGKNIDVVQKDLEEYNFQSEEDLKEYLIKRWGQEIHKLIKFTCLGELGDSHNNGTVSTEKCGWFPKENKTHSIILLGSPGTGKSSVLLTGLVSLFDKISSLGATVALDSPEDRARLQKLDANYRKGNIPARTNRGNRTSIKLSIQYPGEPINDQGLDNRTHYVFTDIPGEDFAESISEQGSKFWVLKILKNAETIIFFFDISVEPSIREYMVKNVNSSADWQSMKNNFERVNTIREGKSSVSQFYLLEQLLQDLMGQRGSLRGMNFICVIPKADLYANREGDPEKLFFNAFFDKLENKNILISSETGKQELESYDNLCSLAGTGAAFSKGKELNDKKSKLAVQKEIIQFISTEAVSALKKIGGSLGLESADQLKQVLNELIQVRLIQRLESLFGKDHVYFLPCSGLGKDTSNKLEEINGNEEEKLKNVEGEINNNEEENLKNDEKVFSLGSVPNQKLSEYVFITPIVLSEKELSED